MEQMVRIIEAFFFSVTHDIYSSSYSRKKYLIRSLRSVFPHEFDRE